MLRTVIGVVAGCAIVSVNAAAQRDDGHDHAQHGGHALGSVEFENSGNAAAQAGFQRGVALLHSFEYLDAGDAFREAQEADAAFALAYWMEALTTEHPLWGESDVPRAREILARLAPTPEARLGLAATARERAFGAAVEALFATDDREARLLAYADSMRSLPERYPEDPEASAFAAIAALTASYLRTGEARAALMDEAIARAEFVFARNEQHPGAAHYLIHAFDHPQRAARGLPFARAYARIAPDAEHALHMPSHIFVQVGMWEDAAASNERAWAASREWVKRRGLSGRHLDFHSLQWLQYAYLQQDRHADALALVDTARLALAGTEGDATGGPDPLTVVTRLAFQYGAETGDWTTVELPPPVDVLADGDSPRAQYFARVDAYHRAIAALLRGGEAEPIAGEGLLALHSRALAARRRGDLADGIALLRRAVELENQIEPTGPPPFLVSQELLGDMLLESGDAAEAVRFFKASLERRPNRAVAVRGLARAEQALRHGDVCMRPNAICPLGVGAARPEADTAAAPRSVNPAAVAVPPVKPATSATGSVADPQQRGYHRDSRGRCYTFDSRGRSVRVDRRLCD